MRYSFDIWNCICKIADAFIIAFVPFRLFTLRHFFRHRAAVFFLSFAILSIFAYGADFAFAPVPFQITLFYFIILGLFYTCLIYQEQFYLKAIVMGAIVSAAMLTRYLAGVLMDLIVEEFRVFSFEMTLGSTVLFLLLTLFFIHFSVIPKNPLPPHYGISMAVFMLTMALITRFINQMASFFNEWILSFGVLAFSIGIILFLYYLFFKLVHEYEEKSANKLTAEQHKHLRESIRVYNEMRSLRHEIKNHVFYMQSLLKQKKLNELEEYFHLVYRQEYDIDMIDSGNDVVNALLCQKTAFAKSKGIQVSIKTALPESLPEAEGSLCTVISNLFDNAIEACEKLPAPAISFALHQTGQYIHILCKNTVAYDICKENPNLQTTKPIGIHGVGLQVVRGIVEKYDGMMEFHMEDMVFVVTLMLKIGRKKE